MWLSFAFLSAFLLGCYDINKKISLQANAVIPVLFFNTLISSCIFLPFILLSYTTNVLDGSLLEIPIASWENHLRVFIKSCIVLSSWIFGYFGLKHLPITIVGPIKATQPVVTLIGAMILFSERLNLYQWIGVSLAIFSFFLLSTSSKKEGIRFTHNKWIYFTIISIFLGSMSGLYDKYLMQRLDVMTVQVWFTVYQLILMSIILGIVWFPHRKKTTPFQWKWNIIFVSIFLCIADWIYFYALSLPGAMISIISMVRRSNVIVTFAAGIIFFKEKNLKQKSIDLLFVLISMLFLYFGSL